MRRLLLIIIIGILEFFFLFKSYPQSWILCEEKVSQGKSNNGKSKNLFRNLKLNTDYGKIPLYFISNLGQMNSEVLYYTRTPEYTLWMTREGLVFDRSISPKNPGENTDSKAFAHSNTFKCLREVSKLIFLGANMDFEVLPVSNTNYRVNYLLGNDPSKWKRNVPTSKAIVYKNIYRDIDLKIYGRGRLIEYEWIVKPGGNPEDIRLEYQGVRSTRIEKGGTMVVETELGKFIHSKPRIYQVIGGKRREVEAEFKRSDEKIYGFQLGLFDCTHDLIIDPVLAYSTFLGGMNYDYPMGLAVDGKGAAYVTGWSVSWDFPTTPGAFQTDSNLEGDFFVTKLNLWGAELEYSTFIGGSRRDHSSGIAVDSTGAVYVTGLTYSLDFPSTPDAFQKVPGIAIGISDAFVAKLNPSGTALEYSTFLGGSKDDQGNAIAIDSNGAAYVAGLTYSSDFPVTPGAFQTSLTDFEDEIYVQGDAFVAKLHPSGSLLEYSTFFGEFDLVYVEALAVDSIGSAYVTGDTYSYDDQSDFPTTPGAFDSTYNGSSDVFVTKLNPWGSSLEYSTFIGGSQSDSASGIAVDARGAAYVTGDTFPVDFPFTPDAYDTTYNGQFDGFVIKLNPSGTELEYSTLIGGGAPEYPEGVAIDDYGAAYVVGRTNSKNFPTTPDAFDTGHNGKRDAFIVKFNPEGTSLEYSTYLGGSKDELSYGSAGIAVDDDGSIYVTGSTLSSDFPTTPGAYDTDLDKEWEDIDYSVAFIAKISDQEKIVFIKIFLQARRLKERAWIILKDYGKIEFQVDDYGGLKKVSDFIIYRKEQGGEYQEIKAISVFELQENAYSFNDAFLEKGKSYAYKVKATNSNGEVVYASNEVTI